MTLNCLEKQLEEKRKGKAEVGKKEIKLDKIEPILQTTMVGTEIKGNTVSKLDQPSETNKLLASSKLKLQLFVDKDSDEESENVPNLGFFDVIKF